MGVGALAIRVEVRQRSQSTSTFATLKSQRRSPCPRVSSFSIIVLSLDHDPISTCSATTFPPSWQSRASKAVHAPPPQSRLHWWSFLSFSLSCHSLQSISECYQNTSRGSRSTLMMAGQLLHGYDLITSNLYSHRFIIPLTSELSDRSLHSPSAASSGCSLNDLASTTTRSML